MSDPKSNYDFNTNTLTIYCPYCNKAFKNKVKSSKETFNIECNCRDKSTIPGGRRVLSGRGDIN